MTMKRFGARPMRCSTVCGTHPLRSHGRSLTRCVCESRSAHSKSAPRDAIFRPSKGVRLGDVPRLRTPLGDFDYRVRDTLIVKPDEVWVLEPTPVTTLTLISCRPFNYIGQAPARFIIRAEPLPTVNVAASRSGTQPAYGPPRYSNGTSCLWVFPVMSVATILTVLMRVTPRRNLAPPTPAN